MSKILDELAPRESQRLEAELESRPRVGPTGTPPAPEYGPPPAPPRSAWIDGWWVVELVCFALLGSFLLACAVSLWGGGR